MFEIAAGEVFGPTPEEAGRSRSRSRRDHRGHRGARGAHARPPAERGDIEPDPDVAAAVARFEAGEVDSRVQPPAREDESPMPQVAAGERLPFDATWLTPELYAIATSGPARTFRDVPRPAILPFARLRAEIAAAARAPGAPAAMFRLFDLLPLLVLSAPARQRGGRKKREARSRANLVLNRIDLITDGCGQELLQAVLREQAWNSRGHPRGAPPSVLGGAPVMLTR